MRITIKLIQNQDLELSDEKLEELKRELADRWGEEYDPEREWDDTDIAAQAIYDGLIDIPSDFYWEVE